MIEIEICDVNGNRYGDGPIISASAWQQTAVLDAAGDGSFSMPVGDERAGLIQSRRHARCYGFVGGSRRLLGEIIIGTATVRTSASGAILDVSGGDLLSELADRTVRQLGLYQDDVHHPPFAGYGALLPLGAVPELLDDDVTTFRRLELGSDWLFVGDAEPFDFVRWLMHAPAWGGETIEAEYWNGSEWESLSFQDDTQVDGATLRRSGDFRLDVPGDWAKTTLEGHDAYWAKFHGSGDWVIADVADLKIVKRHPTGDALSLVMQYAPAGWSLDTVVGHATTGSPVLLFAEGESVLEMLILVAEHTGEHFRLGDGRQLVWMRKDISDSGLRAVQVEDARAADGADELCIISDLERTRDVTPVRTRIYPRGADDLTLRNGTRTAPAGYVLNREENYLEHIAATAQYGLIEQWWVKREIKSDGDAEARLVAAANALFDAALEWLQAHAEQVESFSLNVVKVERALHVGQRVRVIYDEWRDGYQSLAIDASLYIVGITTQVDAAGIGVVALEVATSDRVPATTGAALVMELAEQLRHVTTSTRAGTQQAINQTLGQGAQAAIFSLLEVRNRANEPLLRVSRADGTTVLGPSTHRGWTYDGDKHTCSPDVLSVRGGAGFFGAPALMEMPVVTGDNGKTEVMLTLLQALAGLGLIDDQTYA